MYDTDQDGQLRRRRVLLLTHRLPYPPDRGDRIRSYHLLRKLANHFELGIACTSDEAVWLQHHQLLSTMAKRVAIQPIAARWSRIRGLGALIGGRSITPSHYYRVGLAEQILQWHEQEPFDAVLTFCSGMIEYARLLVKPGRSPQPLHVFDLVDVDSIKWQRYADESAVPMRWVYRLESKRLRRIEAGSMDHFDAITVTTQAEANAYQEHVGSHAKLVVVPNGVDLEYFHPQDDCRSKTIVFVGVLNYRPNVEGISWFAREVMPLLRQDEPEARLLIVGRHPTSSIHALGTEEGIEVIGSVPDVRPYLGEASVCIAPLFLAPGLQNKVLEAMASARAVVCSPGAARGIDAEDATHLLVADTAPQWAEHIRHLFHDDQLRQDMARAARQCVEQRYQWNQLLRPMVSLLGGEDDRSDLNKNVPTNTMAS